jgi:molybdenum cofactor cytidylyltransferase
MTVRADSASDTCIILLGAGRSHRFGGQKLLQLLDGEHLFMHALKESARSICSRVVFVVSADMRKSVIIDSVYREKVTLAVNEEPERGISSSIRTGMNHLPPCGAVLLLAADQPLVSSDLLNRIILKHADYRERIVAACVDGEPRNPALFPSSYFPDLTELKGDRGAKILMNEHRKDVLCIAADDSELMDVDTEDDLNLARTLYRRVKK